MLNWKEFVSFIEQILDSLNKGEIPSTGSLVEVFNKGILERCLKLYTKQMPNMILPMQGVLCRKLMKSREMQQWKLLRNSILVVAMQGNQWINWKSEIEKVYKNIILANEYQSSKLCEALYATCEDKMDELQALRLPTMANSTLASSNATIVLQENALDLLKATMNDE